MSRRSVSLTSGSDPRILVSPLPYDGDTNQASLDDTKTEAPGLSARGFCPDRVTRPSPMTTHHLVPLPQNGYGTLCVNDQTPLPGRKGQYSDA